MSDDFAKDARATVFLSYTHDDREQALAIIGALGERGFDVWWDGLVKGGEQFAKSTEKALETADAVLVLWSRHSVESYWVRDEATRGRDRNCMVSLSIDGTEPPLGFRQILYIDFSKWRPGQGPDKLDALVEALNTAARHPEGRSFIDRANANRAPLSRRALLLGTGVGAGAIALAGLAAWQFGLFGGSASQNSIAVMPFKNLSDDPEQAYFSDGLTEELRATLSLNPQLDVMAQTSSQRFADSEAGIEEIARSLDVANILEGSVRRANERIRIVARLVDGKTGLERWSETFERSFEDVFEVQRAIATEAVDALLATLGAELIKTERIGGTRNARALDAFLRGNALYDLARDEETDRQAMAAFEEAIELDPDYAAAYAAHSRVNTVLASSYVDASEIDRYYDRAMASAQKAIELAPDMAEGHSALGFILSNGKQDLAAARAPYMRSFELGFGNAGILVNYAIYARLIRDFEGARQAIERAKRLDPFNSSVFRSAAIVEYFAGDYDAARRSARIALSHNPEVNTVNRVLGDVALLEGSVEQAREYYELEPSALSRLRGLAIAVRALDGEEAGERALAQLVDEFGDNSLYQQAQVYAQWGETEKALSALERGLDVGDSGMVLILSDPLLDPIRQEPRFSAVSDALGVTGIGDTAN